MDNSLSGYIDKCVRAGASSPEHIEAIAAATLSYLNNGKGDKDALRHTQALETRWYEALRAGGEPAWDVYADEAYLGDLWACWVKYSRTYLGTMLKDTKPGFENPMRATGPVKRVADLGCGIGYTSAMLKAMYPMAEVIGTNLPDIMQTKVAEMMGEEYGFTVVPGTTNMGKVDLVFASEYFEHFPEPVDHLNIVLTDLDPTALWIANAFTANSIGHFDEYEVNGMKLSGPSVAREFNNHLRSAGYREVAWKNWSARRPKVWVKDNVKDNVKEVALG